VPVSNNHLWLAVAGSRKTQGIVDACASAAKDARILVLTYTTANQTELRARLATCAGDHPNIEVAGWFSFLIANFIRPFLPFVFPGKHVGGFDYQSPPQMYAGVGEWSRYFNSEDELRKVHLPQLAVRVEEASNGAGIRRLERVYDRIFIDEVQDLCGYDLEVLNLLMQSKIPIEMVGDIRQAILATNQREAKNKKYMYMGVWEWFRAAEKKKRLVISQRTQTWRCGQQIAALADSMFDASWGFDATESLNETVTDHDGVFVLKPGDVEAYVARYAPLVLRHSTASAKHFDHLEPMNFGDSKGLGRERVLILPTGAIEAFMKTGRVLTEPQAARFYVAVTRAQQSVAIVMSDAGQSPYPVWEQGPDSAPS
jgi:DNA helicase-2/ATP-dependent DNA helicase PcrA